MKPIQFCSSPAGIRSGFVNTPKRRLLSTRTAGAGKEAADQWFFFLEDRGLLPVLALLGSGNRLAIGVWIIKNQTKEGEDVILSQATVRRIIVLGLLM